ncbi:MAG: formate dehydrogenase-N subunit alpha [Hyphomicrobium sp. SCN 65-11]|nr:MAG: formate dehydrogenase-N subunit alpha [Hyphomicrobium sp. SCN 65-11]
MTNSWTDIRNTDLVLVMGGNAAEAHPCGFKWVTEAKAERGAKLMVVDPRFTRSAAVADHYAPIRPGTDVAFLSGVVNYLLSNDKIHKEYVRHYTNAAYLVKEGYAFNEGFFSGYDESKATYDRSSWEYEIGADGYAVRDMTLEHPRSVFQLMKKHFAVYTPEMVSRVSGTPQDRFLKVCDWIASTANGERVMTIMYALGWTQHSHGAQNIRTAAMIQLLCGNIGVPGGGVNALRGHSNVQGITDVGTLTAAIPGYLNLPAENEPTLESHLGKRTFKPLQANQTSYWQNYRKFYVSFLKSFYGTKATPENNFGYDWLPKLDVAYDCLRMFDLINQGKTNVLICQGFNPLMAIADSNKSAAGLAKLKLLVSIDPIETDTARFWENHGEFNNVDPAKIQTEVFMLPVTSFAEESGSLTNSSRCISWKWQAADPYHDSRTDVVILADLFNRIRKAYETQGGKGAEPLLAVDWSYKNPAEPSADELLKELNGKALVDLKDASGKVTRQAGSQLASFGEMRDDGSTDGAMWIYTGVYGPAGNLSQRRDNADPSGLGVYGNWGFSWPANRRIQYNRASADPEGKPWSERKKYMFWNGERWTGPDVPDYVPTIPPSQATGPFIMNPEGVSRLWVRGLMADGPFPVHYEPFESPVTNPVFPKLKGNPAARIFQRDRPSFGDAKEFPIVATTYRLVEHFHYWTKGVHMNAVVQPEFFVEMSEQLAAEKGIKHGGWVRVWSKRGSVKGKAVVTKRLKPLTIDGRTVHTVGLPLNFGFIGVARKANPINGLTPPVGDANSQTPEYKAFLVNVEPIVGPVA